MKNITLGARSLVLAFGVTLSISPAFAGEVQNRVEHQDVRIANGIASGEVTPKEAALLSKAEANIEKQRLADLKANGGKLTTTESKHLNAKLNLQSARIYVKKHNNRRD